MFMTKRRQVNGTPEKRLAAWSELRETGCREFTGKLRKDGYANFKVKGRNLLAHRVAYEVAVGPIPHGLEIRHLCDNRKCINSDHLRPGTRQENVDDCTSQLRHTWGEQSGSAKLTADQVYDIRASDEKASALADRFRITTKTVGQIRARTRWAHLPERTRNGNG